MVAQGISIRSVRKVFGGEAAGTVALERVDLDIAAGEFVSVVGPSGCGKSTLLRLIAGLIPASAGEISVLGRPVRGPTIDCGIVFQQPILLEWRTVLENVLFNIDMRGLDPAAYRPQALQLLEAVGHLDRQPHQLVGERESQNGDRTICDVLGGDPRPGQRWRVGGE